MERRITEEQTTKAILDWLEVKGWTIISFDFPQSGTGISLHPNQEFRITKNKGAFIPDIVAIKNKVVIFFENKDRFVIGDFFKVNDLRTKNIYINSIKKLLCEFEYSQLFYGVGLVYSKKVEQKTNDNIDKVDFIVFCNEELEISVHYDPLEIF